MTHQLARIHWLDSAKGIAIILVVYGHALRGFSLSGLIGRNDPIQISDYIIYTTHVPLFFALSGYLFSRAHQNFSRRFWSSRAVSIIYPYLLWSILQGLVQIALSGSGATNNDLGWGRLSSILWWPISPFWFLYALFFAHVLAALLLNLRPGTRVALALVAFACSQWTDREVIQDVTYGFLYFSLGMAIHESSLVPSLRTSWLLAAALIAAFLSAALACYEAGIPARLAFPATLIGMAAISTFSGTLQMKAPGSVATRILSLCGQCSMAIFVLHLFVIGFARVVISRVLDLDAPYLELLATTVLAVAIPVAVQLAALRFGINEFIGLPFSAPARAGDREPAPT